MTDCRIQRVATAATSQERPPWPSGSGYTCLLGLLSGLLPLCLYAVPHESRFSFTSQAQSCYLDGPLVSLESSHSNQSRASNDTLWADVLMLEEQCNRLSSSFQDLHKSNESAQFWPDVIASLRRLRAFGSSVMDTMLVVKEREHLFVKSDAAVGSDNATHKKALQDFQRTVARRTLVRSCFLQLLTSARGLLKTLPQGEEHADGTFGCRPGYFGGMEVDAVCQAEEEGLLSSLGSYWSELAVNGRGAVPLLGMGPDKPSHAWVRDAWGSHAPADMVRAEQLLHDALQAAASPVGRRSLSVKHAKHLHDHALKLESMDQHVAAEQRFRAAADLADSNGAAALAARSLTRLALSLRTHGSLEETLTVAKRAMDMTLDPVSQFVHASAMISLGKMQSPADARAVAKQLRAATGHLPTPELEQELAGLRFEVAMWHHVDQGGLSKCTMVKDAARFVVCVAGKLFFK